MSQFSHSFPFLADHLSYGLQFAVNTVFPARCIQCGQHVHTAHTLCSSCWQHIPFFFPPWCKKCGLPSRQSEHHSNHEEHLCVSCLRYEKPFHTARSVFGYVNRSHALILRMKNGDSLHASHALSLWIARIIEMAIQDIFSSPLSSLPFPIPVIPVPTSSQALLKRRSYPTAMLARKTARILGHPYLFAPDVLERTLENSQRGKKMVDRIRAVRHAYHISPDVPYPLQKQPLAILIDDVMTTGATVSVCSQQLQKAGVEKVLVVTAARVPLLLPRYPRWLAQS